jgi:hypothetical protein
MWVDTRSVHSDNPGWRDMVSSCFHEWLGTFMIAVRRPCLAMHLQKPYPQKPVRGRLGHTRRCTGCALGACTWRSLGAPHVSWPCTAAVWRASRCRARACHWGETRAKPTALGLGHPRRDEVSRLARSATGAEERECSQSVSCEGKAPCHRLMGWSVSGCWAKGYTPWPTTSSPPQGGQR